MNNYRSSRRGPRRFTPRNRGNSRGRGFGRTPKTMDPSLFVKKAENTQEKEYKPKNSFKDFKINSTLKNNILKKGFSSPTPIQDQAIPQLLEGKDLIGLANTGTGKTAAFLLPTIEKVVNNRKSKVLVIAPTRELADQINDELYSLTRELKIFSVLCTGGTSIYKQISNVKRGFSFIVGTPGRLKDLSDRGILNYSQFDTVVLDEVDRMLDMGFIDDIKYLISKLPKEKQAIFFSATINRKAEEIANQILKNPIKVEVEKQTPGKNVDQDIIRVKDREEKFKILSERISSGEFKKTLIFTRTKREAEKLSIKLKNEGLRTDALHGDKRQSQRTRIIDSFKRGTINTLIATDVASRGIDISDITHVINYDAPENFEDYTHRIGRTGRAGKKGYAITFV